MRTWQAVLNELDSIKQDTKLLKLEQDYLLLSLNETIEEENVLEKGKLIESLRTIHEKIIVNTNRSREMRREYEDIKSTSKPKQKW